MIITFYALEREIASFREHLSQASSLDNRQFSGWQASSGAVDLIMIKTGVGLERAAQTAQMVLDQAPRPTLVISTGVAGALIPELEPGMIVIANRLIRADNDSAGGESLTIVREDLVSWARSAIEAVGLPVWVGPTLSVPKVLSDSTSKQKANDMSGAIAVDMESAAIAQECAKRKIPFLYLRSILDRRDEQLPSSPVLSKSGKVRAFKLITLLLRRPSELKTLLVLSRNMCLAVRSLSTALNALLRHNIETFLITNGERF